MLLIFMGIYNGDPIVLEMDNEATCIHAGAPIKRWSAKSRHFSLDQKYVAQAVQHNIIKVVHRRGTITPENPQGFFADCFTKALPSSLLDVYLPRMQGPPIRGGDTGIT